MGINLQQRIDALVARLERQKAQTEIVAASAREACARRDELHLVCKAQDAEIMRLNAILRALGEKP